MPFFDNQQLIHIAAESFILVVILFYFSYQHKKLYAGLNICTKRIKEQEIILQTHDKIIKNHDMILMNIVQGKEKNIFNSSNNQTQKKPQKKPQQKPQQKPPQKLSPQTSQKSPEKVELPREGKPVIEIIETEIEAELNELKVEKDINKDNKKKDDK